MDWLTKFILGHVYTAAADRSAILSFLRLTNPKCEEDDPSKTLKPQPWRKDGSFWLPESPSSALSFSVRLLPEPASLPLTKAFFQLLLLSAAIGYV